MKTVFFDFGRTLVEHPEDGAGEVIVRSYGLTDERDVKTVRDVLFSLKGAMKQLDDASITREEYKASVLASVEDRLKSTVLSAMDYDIGMLPTIKGMEELLIKLKKDGYRLFIASNMDLFHAAQMKNHRLAKYFEGMIFSSEIRVGKPIDEYYEKALALCGEDPKDCFFIDDLEANVLAAEKFGMKGFLFKEDARAAEKFIYQNS